MVAADDEVAGSGTTIAAPAAPRLIVPVTPVNKLTIPVVTFVPIVAVPPVALPLTFNVVFLVVEPTLTVVAFVVAIFTTPKVVAAAPTSILTSPELPEVVVAPVIIEIPVEFAPVAATVENPVIPVNACSPDVLFNAIEVVPTKVVLDSVAKVPEVGRVTLVAPVVVNVIAFAPEVVKFPPNVIVLEPLLTPVPP